MFAAQSVLAQRLARNMEVWAALRRFLSQRELQKLQILSRWFYHIGATSLQTRLKVRQIQRRTKTKRKSKGRSNRGATSVANHNDAIYFTESASKENYSSVEIFALTNFKQIVAHLPENGEYAPNMHNWQTLQLNQHRLFQIMLRAKECQIVHINPEKKRYNV